MAKKLDAEVMEIMRGYNPRDYLDGKDLQEWDKIADLMDGITVHTAAGETAFDITDDYYDRAARYLDLPLMSAQPPETADIDDPRGRLRGEIGYGLYKRTVPLKNAAKRAFALRYMKYPREAMHVLAEVETDTIIDLRNSVRNLVDSIEKLERTQEDAMRRGINLDKILIRSFGGESGEVLKQTVLISETMHHLKECVENMFGDSAVQAAVVTSTAHLIHLLTHVGGRYPQRVIENRQKRIANKWALKPKENKKRSYSVPKHSPLNVQSTAQPTSYVFDGGAFNTQLITTGEAPYKALSKDGKPIPCRVMLINSAYDDMYDPQVDCIQPRHRPVYSAIESICAQHMRENKPLKEIPIPLGSVLRKMKDNPSRRIDADMTQQIRSAIECMMGNLVTVDCLAEAREYGFDGSEFFIKEPVLDGRLIKASVHGQDTLTLILDRPPILLRYAMQSGKYITCDERYTRGGVKNFSLETLAERDYLERRILTAYRKGKRTFTIVLASMIEALGEDPNDETSVRRIRDKARVFLGAWTQPDSTDGSRFQLIRSFSARKTGRAIAAFHIDLLDRDIASFQLPPKDCQVLFIP